MLGTRLIRKTWILLGFAVVFFYMMDSSLLFHTPASVDSNLKPDSEGKFSSRSANPSTAPPVSTLNTTQEQQSIIQNLKRQLETCKKEQPKWVAGQQLPILTVISGEDMPKLRECIGTLHEHRYKDHVVHPVIVYGFGLEQRYRNEISLWRHVDFYSGDDLYARTISILHSDNHLESPEPEIKPTTALILTAIQTHLRKHGQILYIRPEIVFEQDTLHTFADDLQKKDVVLLSKDQASPSSLFSYESLAAMAFVDGTDAASIFLGFELQCLRGFQCDKLFRRSLSHAQTKLAEKHVESITTYQLKWYDQQQRRGFCYLLLRDDILYPFEMISPTHDAAVKKETKKTTIAFGAPTLSAATLPNVDAIALLKYLLPSFLQSVEDQEWQQFRYIFYVGYDEGDRFFDDAAQRKLILEKAMEMVKRDAPQHAEVAFIQFPYSKGWVTFIWNGLFLHAMNDGCDYFYQVNDDLELNGKGWTSAFVNALKQTDDYGIAGPHDSRHGTGLLTQSFASRKHYDIFGWYYPIGIKDWYSDNWIMDVYGERYVHKMVGFSAHNVNEQGTRYEICHQPNYDALLKESKDLLADYFEDKQKAQDGSDDLQTVDGYFSRRLKRELKHGPRIQKK